MQQDILSHMDSSQGSSFIPKSPVRGAVTKRRVRKVYVFTYLIYIVFICSLLAAAGFWFIHYTADKNLAAAQRRLTEERNKFNASDVTMVTELSERINEAEELVDGQVSLLRALEAVEAVTVAAVSMTGLQYEKNQSAELSFSLVAKTEDFNSARYQREVLSANPVLAGASLTNVRYGATEASADGSTPSESVVSFNIKKTLEPGSILPALPDAEPTTDESSMVETADAAMMGEVETPAVDESVDEETP